MCLLGCLPASKKDMKRLAIIFVLMTTTVGLSAQQIQFFGNYTGSNYNKFQENFGYGMGCQFDIKSKSKIGIDFQYSLCRLSYDEIHPSLIDGISTYIKKVDPQNERFVFKLNYLLKLVNKSKASLCIGPEIGLNYFILNEAIQRYENERIEAGNYENKYSRKNKFGYGLMIEFEIKEIIQERISIFSSVHPEITSFEKADIEGSSLSPDIRWVNMHLGIRYQLKNRDQ